MLSHRLKPISLVKLASITVMQEDSIMDRAGWLDARGGKFMVKAAYKLARRWVEEVEDDMEVKNPAESQSVSLDSISQ